MSSSSAGRCRRSTTALKVPATKVDGCASQVWIVPRIDGEGGAARFDFAGRFGRDDRARADRGAARALFRAAALRRWWRSTRLAELGRLGLDQHLSSQRSNGLRSMVGRIRAIAQSALAQA